MIESMNFFDLRPCGAARLPIHHCGKSLDGRPIPLHTNDSGEARAAASSYVNASCSKVPETRMLHLIGATFRDKPSATLKPVFGMACERSEDAHFCLELTNEDTS
jgi:hypothetical protein